jgi:hypothetical protein
MWMYVTIREDVAYGGLRAISKGARALTPPHLINRIAPSTLRFRSESLTKLGREACTIDSEFDGMIYPKRMKISTFSVALQ